MEKIVSKRLSRSEVPLEATWNLTDLFESRDTWFKSLHNFETNELPRIHAFKGKVIKDAQTLNEAITTYEKLYEQFIVLATFVSLRQSEDGTNPTNQEDNLLFSSVSTKISTALAFFEAEILELTEDTFEQFTKEEPELKEKKKFITDILETKKHKLSKETEETLASLGELTSAPYRIYSVSKAADMQFDSFENGKGEEVPNSFALFENQYEFSSDTKVRAVHISLLQKHCKPIKIHMRPFIQLRFANRLQ